MFYKKSLHSNLRPKCLKKDPGIIYVRDFNEESLEQFVHEFIHLQKNGQEIIPVIINSYGGDVYALFGMLDMIRNSPVPVATICLSNAFSCGAILLSAGTKGKRFIAPTATILVHQVSSVEEGKIAEMKNSINEVTKLNKTILNILDENCNQERGFFQKEIEKLANVDFYVKPKQAKKLGLVDHIGIPTLTVEVEQKLTLK